MKEEKETIDQEAVSFIAFYSLAYIKKEKIFTYQN